MSCDVGEAMERFENELSSFSNPSFASLTSPGEPGARSPSFQSLHLCHSSFSNPSVTLPTSQLILQPFRCFTYVTAHSQTLLSLLLRHRIFTYLTWRSAHVFRYFKVVQMLKREWSAESNEKLLHLFNPW